MLTASDRTGLVDNVFASARAGLVGYDVALDLGLYLTDEDNQTPWKAFAVNVRYVDAMMVNSPHYSHWQVSTIQYSTIQ